MRVLLICTIVAVMAFDAAAQIVLQKAVIANAGGSSANAATKLDYTVGETAVGVASNGTTKGQFGFWNAPTITASVMNASAGPIKEVTVYPNPASGNITIDVDLKTSGNLDLLLYDAAGHLVTSVYSGKKATGRYGFKLDASTLASGTYFIAALVPGALVQTRLTIVR